MIPPPYCQRQPLAAAPRYLALPPEPQAWPHGVRSEVVSALQRDAEPVCMPLADGFDEKPRQPSSAGFAADAKMRQADNLPWQRVEGIRQDMTVFNGCY